MKIQLLNGCSHSQLSVNPKDWKTKKAKILNDWFIGYRFYDSRYDKPKQVMIKGMNSFKTLAERQAETQRLLDSEQEALKNGFNPFNKDKGIVDGSLSFLEALRFSFEKLSVSEVTKRDIKTAITKFTKSAKKVGWGQMPISAISRKHIRLLLDNSSKSEDSFNKNRSYLMILFSVLCELEIVPTNYVRDIKKRKVVKRIREILTDEQRVIVNDYLLSKYPEFHRFLHIFFHSGARISELIRLKETDVDLEKQRFKVVVKKGSSYREVWKTIKHIVMPFWVELMGDCKDGDYLFGKGLKPDSKQIQPYQINKRWYRLVKQRLNIKADFYSLKHLHTTEVVEMIGIQEAANHNSHTSTSMVSQVYDVRKRRRQESTITKLSNKFA